MNPFCIPFAITNMSGALLAMDLGFMGPNYAINTGTFKEQAALRMGSEMLHPAGCLASVVSVHCGLLCFALDTCASS